MSKNHDSNYVDKMKKISTILEKNKIESFVYYFTEDRFIKRNATLKEYEEIWHFTTFLKQSQHVCNEDKWKLIRFFKGKLGETIEFRMTNDNGEIKRYYTITMSIIQDEDNHSMMVGSIRDITDAHISKMLNNDVKMYDFAHIYHKDYGKMLIDKYLHDKHPYATCGLILMDIDCFSDINKNYGSVIGDHVIREIAEFLKVIMGLEEIVMHLEGDQFIVFLENTNNNILVKKSMEIIKSIRHMRLKCIMESITCSVGVCYLTENISGFTYEHLYKNAEWALEKAKENGRNQYAFCDYLQRFETKDNDVNEDSVDDCYLNNDIISTAFEIFEKNNFKVAIEQLMKVIGFRFHLDRITVIHTNIIDKKVDRQYQWTSASAPEALVKQMNFKKEDFLTLFNSYDEDGITVLQYDNMSMYSKEAEELLMQGEAKTVVYAAMYCEGRYVGAVSYVVCKEKRYWSKHSLHQLSELTRIISAYLERNTAKKYENILPEFDSLTGLLTFSRFKEKVERSVVGGKASSYVMVYTDFENFKFINQTYGYNTGDRLLKEFSHWIVGTEEPESDVQFTRVIADQFLLFMPYDDMANAKENIQSINKNFELKQAENFPNVPIHLRTGVYHLNSKCNVSIAIDNANYARKQAKVGIDSVVIYDETLQKKRMLENEIISGIDNAMKKHEFQVFLQPKFSLEDYSIIGAEALVRWIKEDGTMLTPDSFIPLYESNGRIVDLDFYVFEEVVKFLAKNNKLGRKQVPISINASVLHASDDETVHKYLSILQKYQVEPSLIEIELTETETVTVYENVKRLFTRLRDEKMRTSLDDFGAGYSVLNAVIDIPFDTLKIDRAFIQNCESNEKGVYFLQNLIHLVKGLGYSVICEGVETTRQIEILKEAGCLMGQGYWFSKPVPISNYEELMYGDKIVVK